VVERGHEMGRGDEWQVDGRAGGRMGASSAGWMEDWKHFNSVGGQGPAWMRSLWRAPGSAACSSSSRVCVLQAKGEGGVGERK